MPSIEELEAATRRRGGAAASDDAWNGERRALRWPVSGGRLAARFGVQDGRVHTGVDLEAPDGAAVQAAAAGRVVYSGLSDGGYGNLVILQHGVGYQTAYAHLGDGLVRVGDQVRAGQPLAGVGATGSGSRPLLHFEVRIAGKAQNPLAYLRAEPSEETP